MTLSRIPRRAAATITVLFLLAGTAAADRENARALHDRALHLAHENACRRVEAELAKGRAFLPGSRHRAVVVEPETARRAAPRGDARFDRDRATASLLLFRAQFSEPGARPATPAGQAGAAAPAGATARRDPDRHAPAGARSRHSRAEEVLCSHRRRRGTRVLLGSRSAWLGAAPGRWSLGSVPQTRDPPCAWFSTAPRQAAFYRSVPRDTDLLVL